MPMAPSIAAAITAREEAMARSDWSPLARRELISFSEFLISCRAQAFIAS